LMKFFLIAGMLVMPNLAFAADATGIVKQMASKHGVPQSFALRVAKVESGVKCGRVGAAGERGPLQVLPRTAAGLGYKNIRKASCATQTSAGMKHLAICYRGARGNQFRAAACHNGGFGVLRWKRIPKSIQAYARKVTR
jgi:soluble lytic murein transglycosylase-like protein